MKAIGKLLKLVLSIILLIALGGFLYLKFALPSISEAEELQVSTATANIEHGSYLAHHVMICMDCHSERDWTKFSGPLIESSLGKGGEVFDQKMGFPGSYVAKNITPYHLGDWTDGEILRAISSGVSKDGKALFPIMPYTHYGKVDRQDLEDIIAYLRTLEPIEFEPKASESDFPMSLIINTIPAEAQFTQKPSSSDLVAYGAYLVNAAACYDCHTKQDKGQFIGADFAGGMAFPMVDGSISRSANITPHVETGIGSWTEEQFVQRFKIYQDSSFVLPEVRAGEYQSNMPWTMYAGMETQDLKAIFAYLQTLKPVENEVVKFSAAE